jgi:hypothetical protein
MGIEWLEGGKEEKTLCSLNEIVEWEDGRDSLRVFPHSMDRRECCVQSYLTEQRRGEKKYIFI